MPSYSPFFANIRMLRSSHRDLVRWAAELWPGLAALDAPRADVRAEREGDQWRVSIPRDGLAGLDSVDATPSRSDEAAFFLAAFEMRSAALERLVRAVVVRQLAYLEHGQPPVPVPHVIIAEDLFRMGQGAESGATPESLQALVHRLVEGKVLETTRGTVPLAELVAIPG